MNQGKRWILPTILGGCSVAMAALGLWLVHRSGVSSPSGDVQLWTVGWMLIGAGCLLLAAGTLYWLIPYFQARQDVERLQAKLQAMEALNQQTQQFAHHQRLEMLGTLTASIAHEFNNLLTPIMGHSLMAMEQLPEEEGELYDSLLEIYNASRQAKTIISRLSDLSRKNTNGFAELAPDVLVKKTLEVAAPAKPKNVEIQRSLNCWDQRLVAGEVQLSQMLLNLILNGFHAMEPDGGVLTVETSFDEQSVFIRVADTGCGIPEPIQKKIYEPFFTTKETGRGTGLGLAIVAQVVEDHHGTIQLNSKPGQGTSITVSLPRNACSKNQ